MFCCAACNLSLSLTHTGNNQLLATDATVLSCKSLLQQYTQKKRLPSPQYGATITSGGFRSTVTVYRPSGVRLTFTSDTQRLKRDAEEEAAKLACMELDLL